MTARLPLDKLSDLLNLIRQWANKKQCKHKENRLSNCLSFLLNKQAYFIIGSSLKFMKSDGLKYVIISDNLGKNYCGHRVRQTKIGVFLQN